MSLRTCSVLVQLSLHWMNWISLGEVWPVLCALQPPETDSKEWTLHTQQAQGRTCTLEGRSSSASRSCSAGLYESHRFLHKTPLQFINLIWCWVGFLQTDLLWALKWLFSYWPWPWPAGCWFVIHSFILKQPSAAFSFQFPTWLLTTYFACSPRKVKSMSLLHGTSAPISSDSLLYYVNFNGTLFGRRGPFWTATFLSLESSYLPAVLSLRICTQPASLGISPETWQVLE